MNESKNERTANSNRKETNYAINSLAEQIHKDIFNT
jgi:hypothetical protein